MDIGLITAIASKFMDVANDIPKETMEYLKHRSELAYSKLEITLKAAGFTVEKYFNSLADNSTDIEYIESFRNIGAIAAKIEIIKNSTEMSDVDKCMELDRIFEQQRQQQKEANEELSKKRKDHLKAAMLICATAASGVAVVIGNKNIAPKIAKSSGKIVKAIVKK